MQAGVWGLTGIFVNLEISLQIYIVLAHFNRFAPLTILFAPFEYRLLSSSGQITPAYKNYVSPANESGA